MPDLVHAMLRATFAGSLAIVLVLSLRAPLRRLFGAEIAYLAWIGVPLAALATLLPVPARPVVVAPAFVRVLDIAPVAAPAQASGIDIAFLLALAWVIGAVAMAVLFVWQQQRYLRRLGALRTFVHEASLRVSVARSSDGLPALVGAWRPRIVVPADFERQYTRAEQALILAHEDLHRLRGDAFANLAVAALRCLNWFNPLLHYAASRFRHDQELACDAAVIARFPEARRCYADAMLKTQLAGQSRQELRLPVGCRWPSEPSLKERIIMLKQSRPARAMRATGLALVAGGAVVFACAAWASQPPRAGTARSDAGRQAEGALALADARPSVDVDIDASYRSLSPPEYPAEALKRRVEAEVFVKVSIASDGSVAAAQVDHVKPDATSEAAAALGASAVAAVKTWRFNPAQSSGRPVASDVIVPITFSLHGNPDAAQEPAPAGRGVLDVIHVSHESDDAG